MEALIAGAAVAEIFLASLGLAMMLAALALRGAFWMMRLPVRQMRSARPVSAQAGMNLSSRVTLVPVRIPSAQRAR